jgi:hypothetical protein
MSPEEENLVKALLHDANVILGSDQPENVGREDELAGVKKEIRLAETIANGAASAEEIASVADLVHPQTKTSFGL